MAILESQISEVVRLKKPFQESKSQSRLSEGEHQYFAGILQIVDNNVSIHADFAPHVCHQMILLVPSFMEESH